MTPQELKQHKLLSDNEDHFLVRSHDGVEFKVAKKGLGPNTISKISKLEKEVALGMSEGGEVPCYADGGIVQDAGSAIGGFARSLGQTVRQPISDTIDAYKKVGSGVMDFGKGIVEGLSPQTPPPAGALDLSGASVSAPKPQSVGEEVGKAIELSAQQPKPDTGVGAPQQPAPVQGPQRPTPEQQAQQAYNNYMGAVESATHGIVVAQQNAAKAYQALQENYTRQKLGIEDENQKLQADILSQKIDPSRLWSDTSTGGKILASLSIMLGGAASSSTGGRNLALDQLHNAIDRDIDAQKANLNNKQSMLSKNLEKYRDLATAEAVTRSQINAILSAQVAANQAKLLTPEAQMRGMQFVQDFSERSSKFAAQAANSQALNALRLGTADSTQVMQLSAQSPELAKNIVPGPQGYGMALSSESANKVKESESNRSNARSLISEIRTALDKGMGLPKSEQAEIAKGLGSRVQLLVKNVGGLGALSADDNKIIEGLKSDPQSFFRPAQYAKLQQLENFIESSAESVRKGHVINYQEPKKPTKK